MNKIILTDVIAALSWLSDTSDALSASFLKEFFALLAERLSDGEKVEIDKIGTFMVEDGSVVYVPDEEIAVALNSAFDCFEPVVLDDGVTEDMLDAGCASSRPVAEEKAVPVEVAVSDSRSEEEEKAESVQEVELLPPPIPEEDKLRPEENVSVARPEKEPVDDGGGESAGEDDYAGVYTEEAEEGRLRLYPLWKKLAIFMSGIAVGAVASVLVFMLCVHGPVENGLYEDAVAVSSDSVAECLPVDSARNIDAERMTVAVVDSTAAEAAIKMEEENAPIYYKVEKTSYLSNISRKYYGHYAFWIYIYIENKDKIEDPDNLPVGIVLVIPSPEKYGIDKNDEGSIHKAEKLAVEMFGE